MRKLLIGVAVLAVLLVAADRISVAVAENQISDRREYYNDTVTTFNTRIQQIPDTWVAQWQGMQAAELFKVDEADRRDVEIKFAMAS